MSLLRERPAPTPAPRGRSMKAAQTAAVLLSLAGVLALSVGAQQVGTKPVITAAPPQSAPAPVEPGPAVTRDAVDPNYVIGPGDSLEINVFNEPKFSGSLPVRPDGMISIALVGDIPAAGDTPMQLGAEITSRLKRLITDPSVTVSVLAINSKRVYLV